MTLMLELSPETEARLRRKAGRAGQSLSDYLLAVANAEANREEPGGSEACEEVTSPPKGSAADLFAGRIGRFRSGGNGSWSRNTDQIFVTGKAGRSEGSETYLLSESGLAKDWLRPEEEEAWQDL